MDRRLAGPQAALVAALAALALGSFPLQAQQPPAGTPPPAEVPPAVPPHETGAAVTVGGRILDAADQPAVGYRVVFRVPTTSEVFLSAPSDEEGNYNVSLPSGRPYQPAAVISPSGERVALTDAPLVAAQPGARQDLRLDFAIAAEAVTARSAPFPGADRLFLAFVEDDAYVGRWRLEVQAGYEDFSAGDVTTARLVGAASFSSLPRFEFGARQPFVSADLATSGSESGLGDTEAWSKFHVTGDPSSPVGVGVGALVGFPTGDSDAGLSAEAWSSKLFGTLRTDVLPVTLSVHAGVRFTGDGEIAGTPVEGATAAEAGIAGLLPLGERIVFLGELTYAGKRFEDAEDDARVLLGANWRLFDTGQLRLAVAGGLTDGAPDLQFLVGLAFQR